MARFCAVEPAGFANNRAEVFVRRVAFFACGKASSADLLADRPASSTRRANWRGIRYKSIVVFASESFQVAGVIRTSRPGTTSCPARISERHASERGRSPVLYRRTLLDDGT